MLAKTAAGYRVSWRQVIELDGPQERAERGPADRSPSGGSAEGNI